MTIGAGISDTACHGFHIDKPRWSHYYRKNRFKYRLPIDPSSCEGKEASIEFWVPIFGIRIGRLQMAKKSGPTPRKRLKEIKLLDKRKAKEAKRIEAKERRAEAREKNSDEDPDIAGIKPGPQPLPEQWNDIDDDE